MTRFFYFMCLILLGTLLGGLYGIFHDEVTYSISQEFYIKVRFGQEDIRETSTRVGVAIIGWKNTWFYSMIISTFLALCGLVHRDNKKFIRYTIQSFFIAMTVSFLFGFAGWLSAEFFSQQEFNQVKLPQTIQQESQFKTVQLVHNFSYMGGIIGMLVGIGWQLGKRKKDNKIFGRKSDDL